MKLRERLLPSIAMSEAWWRRAQRLIPAGTQTLAKGPGQHVNGVAPKYAQRGKGGRLWDVDGNEFVDLTMGVGPLVLGYTYPEVDEAIRKQLADGITFSLMHPLEVEVAETIRALVPGAECVRFSKTGCDVTSAAVRLARAYTGRERVLCCGYHGWHDWYLAVTDRTAGIPSSAMELTHTFAYNDLDSVRDALDDNVACVVLEPMTFEAPKPGFLSALKDLCAARGALLVFDEMWTGFRFATGGAQERFGVVPDLACFSKAVANGMPLSVLAGRREVMNLLERDVFFFTTFGGEALSLAAALATLRVLQRKNVCAHLAATGQALREGFDGLVQQLDMPYVTCVGDDCRTLVAFDARAGDPLVSKSFVQQEMLRRGVLWGGFHNVCFSHTGSDIDQVLTAYAEVLPRLREALRAGNVREQIGGELLEPVFRKTSHFHTRPQAS